MTYVFAVLSTVIGGINLYAIVSFFNGRSLRFFQTERGALISAFIVALVMCAFGINITVRAPSLKVAGFISGILFGIPLLVIFAVAIFNREIPLIHSYRNGLIALAVAMGIKWSLSIAQTVNSAIN